MIAIKKNLWYKNFYRYFNVDKILIGYTRKNYLLIDSSEIIITLDWFQLEQFMTKWIEV